MTTMNNMSPEQINKKFLKRDTIHRAAEFLLVEVIISVVIAGLVNIGIIPPSANGLLVLGAGLLIYLVIVGRNCFEYFWVVNDRKTYFLSSVLAYAPVVVLGLILRYWSMKVYSWMFFMYKMFAILPIGRTGANLLTHLIVFAVITFIGLFFIPTPQTDVWDED